MKFDKYDSPQIQPTGAATGPGSQLTISHAGNGEVAAHIGEIGSKLGAVFAEEQIKADKFSAQDRELKFATEANDLLNNSTSGYLFQEGEQALDTAGVHDKLEALRQKYAGTLQTDASKQQFDLRTRVRMQSYSNAVENHAGQERRKVYAATADATVKDALDNARLAKGNPELIESVIAMAEGPLADHFRLNLGLPAEKVQQLLGAFQSDVYESVLQEYQAKDQGIEGLQYLNTIRDRLEIKRGDGGVSNRAAHWDGIFKPMVTRESGESLAEMAFRNSFGASAESTGAPTIGGDNLGVTVRPPAPSGMGARDGGFSDQVLWKQTPNGDVVSVSPSVPQVTIDDRRPNLMAAEAQIQKMYEDKKITLDVHDAAIQRTRQKIADWEVGFNRDTAVYWDQALQAWDVNHRLTDVPPGVEAELRARGNYHTLEQMDRNWKMQGLHGPPTQGQVDAMTELWFTGSNNPNAFDKMTDQEFKKDWLSRLAPSQQEEAVKYVASMRSRQDKQARASMGAVQMMEEIGRARGAFPSADDGDLKSRDPGTWGEEQRNVLFVARSKLNAHLQKWIDAHPKDPIPPQEYYEPFIRQMFAKGWDQVSNRYFKEETTKITAQVRGHAWTPRTSDIEPTELEAIKSAYRNTHGGKDPDEATVINAYYNMYSAKLE
jgi:hypothetical protein